jgi:hypothetical protein
MQKAIAVLMSFLLVLTTFPVGAGAQNAPAAGTSEQDNPLSAVTSSLPAALGEISIDLRSDHRQ